MKRKTLVMVVVVLSISLLGLEGMQLYWINLLYRVPEEQFGRTVQEILTQVNDKPETQEAVLQAVRAYLFPYG